MEMYGRLLQRYPCIGVGYERAKDFDRAEFNASEASMINDVQSKKDPGPCFRSSGPHFQKYMHKVHKPS